MARTLYGTVTDDPKLAAVALANFETDDWRLIISALEHTNGERARELADGLRKAVLEGE
jgi:hypothetical protein